MHNPQCAMHSICSMMHVFMTWQVNGESKLGRQVDALALGGDEGRDKLR